jgi:hypothetical protein
MAGLKRTPIDRPSGAELVRQIAGETETLPPTRREPEATRVAHGSQAQQPPRFAAGSSTATEQINFRGSPELARILARLAAEQGSIRLVIARLLQDAGHIVPEADLLPPPGRRRL